MSDRFDHVPATGNLQAFLREETQEYGDGVADLLSFARDTLDGMEAAMTEEEFSIRQVALEGAEEAWNLDDDIEGMRAELQRAFADWPAPLAQAA
jgi:hypothetical protein